ncbi:hypothetical protein GOHSU_29_00430 [Gordonia hirsuta DSM 44140 = NBRC 16056]|uniref:Uncharacterized protein n=1 Tax=Gordonia hirsuta DSM 44140 = NBRC 16056 TaxID=1121927 RepID=L7LAA3_9ACTN|nr:hypothetical protein [Gordonia hirsuta]GAC58060.1 hypothetical protein GOHSU_29_00430 [Gordonia hirsuta DSM 44140 = NBRC 16056]
MASHLNRQRVNQIAVGVAATVVTTVIIWLDVASAIWQEVVILSGLAAGFVTFLLTVFVLDKVLARSTARRWAPVNRLAFTEFLHALADDDASEISRGQVITRSLTPPAYQIDPQRYDDELEQLRDLVLRERALLSDLLSRWAPFLASSGDNEAVLQHIADIALSFDRIRDAALEAESDHDPALHARVSDEVRECNSRLLMLTDELRRRLTTTAA